jgi:hypothetical protein
VTPQFERWERSRTLTVDTTWSTRCWISWAHKMSGSVYRLGSFSRS